MKKLVFITLLVAITAGCSDSKTDEKVVEQRIKVNTAKVLSVRNDYSLGYSGTIEASQTIPLSFRISGTIDKIYVEVGEVVKKGQLLASVDNSDMQNIYNTIYAKFQQARDAYDRLKIVYNEGSLPEIKWVEMKSNLEQATSSLELAKNNLEKCNLLAPVDGIVGRRNIEPGQASISLTLAPIELVKIETVFVKISVPENEINKIIKGQKAGISVSALNDKQYEGIVKNISPVAEIMSRTYTVKISVKNTGLDLKPGMVCDVTIDFETETTLLVVPYKAVGKDSEGKNYVYMVSEDNNTVKKQYITVGRYHDAGIEVIGGLAEGQTVVSEGCEKLSDNSLIRL
jgi:RND family efflux transporter MFP subunit